MENKEQKTGLNISTKCVIIAVVVILALMILTYVLTLVIPGGSYTLDENGKILPETYEEVEGGIPFWKWLLSPILVLGADGNVTLIVVIIFILIIGGVFNSLDKAGVMRYMLDSIVNKYGDKKYTLMAVISFFFMAMGSLVGSFEEVIPMLPIVVALSVELGWDRLTGMGMCVLAVACGFAAGLTNPFTVGVAQSLVGLPMFSGIWLRAIAFVLIYALLITFLRIHAKKIEKEGNRLEKKNNFVKDEKKAKGLTWFASILGVGILLILSSTFITVLQDYTTIIVALMFLIGGIVGSRKSGMSRKELGKTFFSGLLSLAPATIMLLMAASIKYTMVEGNILYTILHAAVNVAGNLPKPVLILFIYLIALVLNFFISSGSAKAILLIPLITPMAEMFGISAQLCVLAYVFGDGFSNVFYPTNPVTLISCGIADETYSSWVKYTWKFQLINLVLTSGILLLGLALNYQ